MSRRVCSIDGCAAAHNAQGLCLKHYMRALRAGEIERRPRLERSHLFWTKVKQAEGDGCWEWQATIMSSGYGQFHDGTRLVSAHRYAYELENGPIPDDLFACHTCDNRKCVRPSHIFLGTHQDNMADMASKGRAHREVRKDDTCANGHLVAGDNAFVSCGYTKCRECARQASRRRRERRRVA